MSDNDLVCDLIVDAVVEWLGKKYRKSQIKLELAKINGGERLDFRVVDHIISLAKKKIRNLYHVDPIEFKGSSIEFYQSVIRNPKAKIKDKLVAQQRIDVLLGLEHLATDDPAIYAEKVKAAMKAMDDSVTGQKPDEDSSQESTLQSKSKEQHGDPDEEIHDEKLAEDLKDVELTDDGLSLKNE